MSDGPHRSLPLRRHWKKFAERAATHSYSLDEVAEALPIAIIDDFKKEAPLSQLRELLLGEAQTSLFYRNCTGQIEGLRSLCHGSTAGNMLIDCAIEAIADGLTGETALSTVAENASSAYSRSIFRQIEEHYQRKEPGSEINMRARLSAVRAQASFAAVVSELMSANAGSSNIFRVAKRTGIDEGPQL